MTSQCKSCMDKLNVTDELINEMLTEANIDEKLIVSKEIYKERLTKCKNCPSLMNGNTCMHCGCLVQYRARIADNNCPYPVGERWGKVEIIS